MEEGIDMESDKEKIAHQQQILNYCFTALDYIRSCDAVLFKRAKEYAEDQTDIEIEDFEIRDVEDEEELDEGDENDVFKFGIGDDDED
jgi:hypothetical protein